jgi:Tat protein secretion system quality control protein TatD with DNase activity
MIDTHCHLTFRGLHDRLDEVLAGAAEAGVACAAARARL